MLYLKIHILLSTVEIVRLKYYTLILGHAVL